MQLHYNMQYLNSNNTPYPAIGCHLWVRFGENRHGYVSGRIVKCVTQGATQLGMIVRKD